MPKIRYLQLADAIATKILKGDLAPGEKLPTHRKIAEDSGVALATATRAYRELEDRGLIVGEHGRGVFVKDPNVPLALGVEQPPPTACWISSSTCLGLIAMWSSCVLALNV